MCGSGCCSPGVVGVEREAACPYRSSAQSVAAPEVCARWACDVWRWLRASSGVVGVDCDAACPYRSSALSVAAPRSVLAGRVTWRCIALASLVFYAVVILLVGVYSGRVVFCTLLLLLLYCLPSVSF